MTRTHTGIWYIWYPSVRKEAGSKKQEALKKTHLGSFLEFTNVQLRANLDFPAKFRFFPAATFNLFPSNHTFPNVHGYKIERS